MADDDPETKHTYVAIISAGAMGAGIARRMNLSMSCDKRCTVLTVLKGRSQTTRERARDAGMVDVSSLEELLRSFPTCRWLLSILPPSEAEGFLREFISAVRMVDEEWQKDPESTRRYPTFVDLNAKSPSTASRFAQLFNDAKVPSTFIDGSIIGLPPHGDHTPSIYACASSEPLDQLALSQFHELNKYGLKVKAMKGDGATIGDASALKMTFSGIMKGMVGLYMTMILAAHSHSPLTAKALIEEIRDSQPNHLRNIAFYVPNAIPKAYRFMHEMSEMESFLQDTIDTDGSSISQMFAGFERIFDRVARSEADEENESGLLTRYSRYSDALMKGFEDP